MINGSGDRTPYLWDNQEVDNGLYEYCFEGAIKALHPSNERRWQLSNRETSPLQYRVSTVKNISKCALFEITLIALAAFMMVILKDHSNKYMINVAGGIVIMISSIPLLVQLPTISSALRDPDFIIMDKSALSLELSIFHKEDVIREGLTHFLRHCPEQVFLLEPRNFHPLFLSNMLISSLMLRYLNKKERPPSEGLSLLEAGFFEGLPPFWSSRQNEIQHLSHAYRPLTHQEKMSLHSLMIDGRDVNHLDHALSERFLKAILIVKKVQIKLFKEISRNNSVWRYGQWKSFSTYQSHIRNGVAQIERHTDTRKNFSFFSKSVRFALSEFVYEALQSANQHDGNLRLFEEVERILLKNAEGKFDPKKVLEFFSDPHAVEYIELVKKAFVFYLLKEGKDEAPSGYVSSDLLEIEGNPFSDDQAYRALSTDEKKAFEAAFLGEGATEADHEADWYPLFQRASTYFGRLSDTTDFREQVNNFQEITYSLIQRLLMRHEDLYKEMIKKILEEDYDLFSFDLEKACRYYLHFYCTRDDIALPDVKESLLRELLFFQAAFMHFTEHLKESIKQGEEVSELDEEEVRLFNRFMELQKQPQIIEYVQGLFITPSERPQALDLSPPVPEDGTIQRLLSDIKRNRSLKEQSLLLRALFSGYRGNRLSAEAIALLERLQ